MPRKFKTQDGKSSEAIRGLWEGAYVSQFVRLFQRKFGFQSLTTQELEDALLDPESLVIPDLCARLLRFLTKQPTILISNFEVCLQDLLEDRQVSFSKSPWRDLTPSEKLSALKWLLDHAYESKEEELSEFLDDHYDPDDLRGICVGQDAFDNVYWYLEDLRLYREAKKAQRSGGSSGPGEWDCICLTLSDWQLFLKQFRKSSNPQEKQLYAFLGCHLFPLVQAHAQSLQVRDRATENRWLLEREREEVSRNQAMKCNGASSMDTPEAPLVAPTVATSADLGDCKISAPAKEEEGPPSSCAGSQQQTPPSGQGGPPVVGGSQCMAASPSGGTIVNGGGGPPAGRDCGPPPLIEASSLQPLSDNPSEGSVTSNKENAPPMPGTSPDMTTSNNTLPPLLQQQQQQQQHQIQLPPQHPSMMMMGGSGVPPMSSMPGGGMPHQQMGAGPPHHMGAMGQHTGGLHPSMPVQALPSNLGVGPPKGAPHMGGPPPQSHHQGGMDAQYMQQQSQIFVFTTALANQAAEAVLTGQCPSIIAFHCAQPGTKRFLEKHPLKIQQFNKQSPAAWLNSLAQMKQQRGGAQMGPMKGASIPQHFGGPTAHPQGGSASFCGPQHGCGMPHAGGPPSASPWTQQQPGGGVPHQEMWVGGATPYGPAGGGPRGGRPPHAGPQGCGPPNGGGGSCFSAGFQGGPGCGTLPGNPSQTTAGVKVPDENLTPQQRQHREEQLAMIRKMHQLLFPEATGMPPSSSGPQSGGPPVRQGPQDPHHHGGLPNTAPHGGPSPHPAFQQGCMDHQHPEGSHPFPGGPASMAQQQQMSLQNEWHGMPQQQKPYFEDRRRKTPTHPHQSAGPPSFGPSGPCTPDFAHSPSAVQGGPYGPTRPGSCPNPNFNNGPSTRPASCTGFNSPGSFSNPPTPSNFSGVPTPGSVTTCGASPGPGMVFSPGPNPCSGAQQGGAFGSHGTPCSGGFAGAGAGGTFQQSGSRPSPCSIGFGGGQGGAQIPTCGSPALQPFSPVRPGTSPTGQGFTSGPSPTHYGSSSPAPRSQAPPSPAGASPRIGPPPPYAGGASQQRAGSLASPHPPASPLPSPAADPSRQFPPRLTNPSPGSMQTTPLSSPKPPGRPGSAGGRAPATPTTPMNTAVPSPSSGGKKRAATPLQENQGMMQDFAGNGTNSGSGDPSSAFGRNVSTPSGHHPRATPPGGMSKEPNLMPVPSPQQIQYLSSLEGQELTIQKQPNTGLHAQEGQQSGGNAHSGNMCAQQPGAQPHLLPGMPHAEIPPLDMGPTMTSENSQGSYHSSCSSGGDMSNPRFPPTAAEINPSTFDGQQRYSQHEPHYRPGYVDQHQARFGMPHPQGGAFPDGVAHHRYQVPPQQGGFPMNPRDFGSPAGPEASIMSRPQSFRGPDGPPSSHIQNLQKMAPPYDPSKGEGGHPPELVQDPLDGTGGSPDGGMPPTTDFVPMMPHHGGARPPYAQSNVANTTARSGGGRGARGRASASFAGMQVKPNAPNTIQYLPARPQGPQRAQGLEFLQRFAPPLTNLDAKVPTQNLQYFPPSGPPRSPMMMRSGGAYVTPNGTHVSGAPPMQMMGAGGPFQGKQGMTGPHGEVAQPLPPTVGQTFGYKQQPFYGPTTADPNYAVQFHNFQQQLYATNTRGQGGSASQAGAGFFGPK